MSRKILGMSRTLAVAVAVLVLSSMLFATNASAATVPTSSSPNFYTMEKTCAEIIVYLHGSQSPTMTCATKTKMKVASGISPHTQVAKNCADSNDLPLKNITMQIETNFSSDGTFTNFDVVCFINSGYWAYYVHNVFDVWTPNNVPGWFLWYIAGSTVGTICNINSGNNNGYFSTSGPTINITQIYPGAQNAHGSSSYYYCND